MKTLVRSILAGLLMLAAFAPSAASQAQNAPAKKPAQKSPLDHLRAARTALDDVNPESLTADAGAKVKEVRRRLATLEDNYVSHGKKSMSKQETPSGSTRVRISHEGNWSAQVPDIDKLLGGLIGSKTSIARLQESNDALKRKLAAVRAHLTAFAKGATGTSGPPR